MPGPHDIAHAPFHCSWIAACMWAGMAKSAGQAPLAQANPSSLRTKAPERASFATTCSGQSSPPSVSRAAPVRARTSSATAAWRPTPRTRICACSARDGYASSMPYRVTSNPRSARHDLPLATRMTAKGVLLPAGNSSSRCFTSAAEASSSHCTSSRQQQNRPGF